MSECAFLTFPHQSRPLKSLPFLWRSCPTFLGLQSASFSDSHSFFLLLFFIYQIAFHFLPLLSPPLSVTATPFSLSPFSPSSSLSASLTLPNVPLSFPLGFFLLYLLHMAPPGAILEQKGGAGEILWPGKLHLIFCIHAKAISPTGVYWCGPLLIAVSLLFYLGGG